MTYEEQVAAYQIEQAEAQARIDAYCAELKAKKALVVPSLLDRVLEISEGRCAGRHMPEAYREAIKKDMGII